MRLEHWAQRTLVDFAREGLKATILAALALGKLEMYLARSLGPQRAHSAVGELTMGIHPQSDADLPAAVQALASGRWQRDEFLKNFGHRGPNEMELASPRWSEDHGSLDRLFNLTVAPLRPSQTAAAIWEDIAKECGLSPLVRDALAQEVTALHEYLSLREEFKHHFMRGYAIMRRLLVELDRRHHLNGGVFYLTPDELPALEAGTDYSSVVAARKRRRLLALSIDVPAVIFSDDFEAIGRPVPVAGSETLQGVPLSAGVAEGPALVLTEPVELPAISEPYVLVCPSTDPAWVPLFINARGLVMETGGVLSHGAIVAREFGLPAVAGLPGVVRSLQSGQRLRVDGGGGTVKVIS
jgi:pyruvate,water dikinase